MLALFVLAGILIATFTQVSFGGGAVVPKAGTYRASVRVMIDMPRADIGVATAATVRLMLMTHTHSEVIMSQAMSADISERVGGAYDEFEIYESLEAFGLLPTQFVEIQVDGDSPDDAVALAAAAAAAYQDWLIEAQDAAGTPQNARIVATRMDAPTIEEAAPLTNEVIKWMTFGAVAGLTVGIVFVFGLPLPEPRQPRRGRNKPGRGRPETVQINNELPSDMVAT